MIVQLKIEVKDQVEAYLLINKINLKNKVKEVVFDKVVHKFDTDNKPKDLFKCQKNIQEGTCSQQKN